MMCKPEAVPWDIRVYSSRQQLQARTGITPWDIYLEAPPTLPLGCTASSGFNPYTTPPHQDACPPPATPRQHLLRALCCDGESVMAFSGQ
ncbi:hypothetical protein E2C01_064120 [Portunus trituberculatus]|uniref:Uncharacterized protein n=1 Tax=Portunus trituberculatus TaxID=210409 RepID=A0A5B7HKV8_PORTR|nr:hypothetical protein [Portunus trituberculatus]